MVVEAMANVSRSTAVADMVKVRTRVMARVATKATAKPVMTKAAAMGNLAIQVVTVEAVVTVMTETNAVMVTHDTEHDDEMRT
jgi:hypothetical protein